jgi:hypothetical protein
VPAGAIVTSADLAPSGSVPLAGMSQVGVALKAGEVPAGGLVAGQDVLITLLPQNAQGTELPATSLTTATVWAASAPDTSGTVTATVLVPAWQAVSLAGYASRGEVALVAVSDSAKPPAATPPPAAAKPAPRASTRPAPAASAKAAPAASAKATAKASPQPPASGK